MRKNKLEYGKGIKDFWGKVLYKNKDTGEIKVFTREEWTDITCMVYQDVQQKDKTGYEYK